MTDVEGRLDRLESTVERQQERIAAVDGETSAATRTGTDGDRALVDRRDALKVGLRTRSER